MFADDQLDALHRATLDLLRLDGVRVLDSGAVESMRAAGCSVEGTERILIPSGLIEQALDTAPRQVELYSWAGERRMELGRHHTYFGPGADLPNTLDLIGSERRPSVLADITAISRLCDGLENIDFVMSMGSGSDVSGGARDQRAFLAMLENTTKPIVYTAGDLEGLGGIVRMAELAAGGVEELAARPFLVACLEPDDQLVLTGSDLARLRLLVDKGLPWMFAPASAPASAVEAHAHALSALTLAQMMRPGAPVILGTTSGSSPHRQRQSLGIVELVRRRYGLPAWGVAGVSSSKLPDIQAGIESALSILATVASGVDLVQGVGSLESGEMGSFEMVVIADEIIGFVRRQKDEGEDMQSGIFDRSDHQGWIESGRPNMIRSARDKAIEIIGSHVPSALPDSISAELEEMAAADERGSSGNG